MGGYIGAATGMMIPGIGGMDSVPIMATPGEFMMRKASVQKYGLDMMQRLNNGSYTVPTYDVGGVPQIQAVNNNVAVTGAPVYNSYGINVTVAGTNASADEIANKTITKIKEMKNVTIRGSRG